MLHMTKCAHSPREVRTNAWNFDAHVAIRIHDFPTSSPNWFKFSPLNNHSSSDPRMNCWTYPAKWDSSRRLNNSQYRICTLVHAAASRKLLDRIPQTTAECHYSTALGRLGSSPSCHWAATHLAEDGLSSQPFCLSSCGPPVTSNCPSRPQNPIVLVSLP